MTPGWVLLSLLLPVVGLLAGSLLEDSSESAAILANAVAPGTGLAMLGRPFLESVSGGLICLVSLLVIGGPDNLGMYVPVMILGGVWASLYTSLNPLQGTQRPMPGSQATTSLPPVPTPTPTRATTSTPAGKSPHTEAGYTVTVTCTECGAGVEVPVLHRMARCPYCGSSHLVVGQGETLYVAIPDAMQTSEDLVSTVLEYYRYEYYKKLYERHVAPLDRRSSLAGPNGGIIDNPEMAAAAAAAEARIGRAADTYRARLQKELHVQEIQQFWSPYWHGMGTLYEAIFGRDRRSLEKKMTFAIRTIEASAPANDGVELPAMGHLSYLRTVIPAAELDAEALTLPITRNADALETAYGHLDRKQIDGTLQRIQLGTIFSQEITGLLWRPWRIVEAHGPDISDTLLIDAAAASVSRKLEGPFESPLEPLPDRVRQAGHALTFIPMECPNCGFELPFDVNAVVHFCTNCHWAFVIESRVKKQIPYAHAALEGSEGGDLVPFWEFPLTLRDASGRVVTGVRHLTDGIDGTLDQIGEDAPEAHDRVLVPAFRVINSRLMTSAFDRLARFTVPFNVPTSDERFPLDEKPKPWSVSLPEAEARSFLPLYTANIFSLRDLARASLHDVTARLFKTHQQIPGRLVYVRVPRPLTESFRAYIGRFTTPVVEQAEGTGARRNPTA